MKQKKDVYVVLVADKVKGKVLPSLRFEGYAEFQAHMRGYDVDPPDSFIGKPYNAECNGLEFLCFHFEERNPFWGMVDTDSTDVWMIRDEELDRNKSVKFYVDSNGVVYRRDLDSGDVRVVGSHVRDDRANPRVKLLGKYFNVDSLIGNRGDMTNSGKRDRWEF